MIASKTNINCIIIESDLKCINILSEYLNVIDDVHLEASFTKSAEAIHYLDKNNIDLVFINAEMDMISCFDSIELVQAKRDKRAPKFIILANDDRYALKSYRYGILDYLVKPIDFKDIMRSVDKYYDYRGLQAVFQSTIHDSFFFIEVEGVMTRIDLDEIIYIESFGSYVSLYRNNQRLLLLKSLNDLEKILDPRYFMRIYKSNIVSLRHIVTFNNSEVRVKFNHELVTIPLGRTFKHQFKKRLQIA